MKGFILWIWKINEHPIQSKELQKSLFAESQCSKWCYLSKPKTQQSWPCSKSWILLKDLLRRTSSDDKYHTVYRSSRREISGWLQHTVWLGWNISANRTIVTVIRRKSNGKLHESGEIGGRTPSRRSSNRRVEYTTQRVQRNGWRPISRIRGDMMDPRRELCWDRCG